MRNSFFRRVLRRSGDAPGILMHLRGDYENNNCEMFNDIPRRAGLGRLNFKAALKSSCAKA